MKEPRKLHILIDYSSDISIPEIDSSLDDFITHHNEHLDSHYLHEGLKDLGVEHVGESVFILDDAPISEDQFEIKIETVELPTPQKKSLIKRFLN